MTDPFHDVLVHDRAGQDAGFQTFAVLIGTDRMAEKYLGAATELMSKITGRRWTKVREQLLPPFVEPDPSLIPDGSFVVNLQRIEYLVPHAQRQLVAVLTPDGPDGRFTIWTRTDGDWKLRNVVQLPARKVDA